MLAYHVGAFDGSAAYAATASRGRAITVSVSTSTMRASDGGERAVRLDDALHRVPADVHARLGLEPRHAGPGDGEAHGLLELDGEVRRLAAAVARDDLVVPRLAL